MFCPPPEEESQNNCNTNRPSHKNGYRKRKKKPARKYPQNGVGRNKKTHSKLAQAMSSWAENFTFAANWQLKHQLAYWKARAKALEYENGILHEIIRKKNYVDPPTTSSNRVESESTLTHVETESEDEEECGEEGEEDDFEVSEEFIQFLQANAKFKEDARRERERLKAKDAEDERIAEMEAGPPETQENREEVLKQLYGDKWQRIAALEMSLQSQFIQESDKEKPTYWPNIPLNFNFGS
ncbi:hypothetical protein ABMA28_002380 [Loxostege sticticalis]|uniref:Gem-associated protein 8 n=1 Tax=Loxostege sticticalis TaxID=481309 RepID=A0ABD0T0Q0_LOXSC